jgi:olefin beta-lactone synthetase
MPCSASSSSQNISARLAHWAAETPLSTALIDGERTLSFASLDDEAARLGAGLEALGIGPGSRVALMVPPSVELYALAFGLFRVGAAPVFVDPGVGWKHLKNCLDQAAPHAFIGTPKAHLGRVLAGWAKKSIVLNVVVRGFFPGATGLGAARRGAGMLRAPKALEPGRMAAILFTSGSTGEPKGAVYTHEMFGAQTDALGVLFGCRPGEVSVATFPLFGLFDVALGMTVVLPRMDATRPGSVDPKEILGPIEKHGAVQLFGSPALLDRLARHGAKIPKLKRVLTAGAPVSSRLIEALGRLTPASTFTPYGATEALPVACIAGSQLRETAGQTARGYGVCVGKPVAGVEVKLLEPDAAGIGEIAVRGPVVSAEYYGRPDATAASKLREADGTFWHRMGDMGRLDEQGRLWFCGRKSDRVAAGAGWLYTACVEGVFDAHPAVKRSGLAPDGTVCVEREPGHDITADELMVFGRAHEPSRAIKRVLFHRGFPVDARHNAKIRRAELLSTL